MYSFDFLQQGDQGTKECRYFETAVEALGAYTALYDQQTQPPYSFTRVESILSHKIGSDKMMQVCMWAPVRCNLWLLYFVRQRVMLLHPFARIADL